MFSKTITRRLLKNTRGFQKKSPTKRPKFNTDIPEEFDPEKKLAEPVDMLDMSAESQEKFLNALGPELQDIYHKGAMGEIDEHEISKYMRNMTPEEIQRISTSPAFTEFLQSDPKFTNMPSQVDPDVPLSREDQEKLSSMDWNDINMDGEEEGGGGEGEGGMGQLDKDKIIKLFEKFQKREKNDRLRSGKE